MLLKIDMGLSFLRFLHPPKNPFLDRYFAKFPRIHILKFLVDHGLHRLLGYSFFKIIYYGFKILNRLELQNAEGIVPKMPNYRNDPFLIVENHNADLDVIMHMSVWTHLGYYPFVFTLEGSFDPRHPIETMLIHVIEMIPRFGPGAASVNRMVKRLLMGDIVNIFPAGTYPLGRFANTGFVIEGYTGAARVAYQYWKLTGKKLIIQPVCSLGANIAFPPRKWLLPGWKPRKRHRHKHLIKNPQNHAKWVARMHQLRSELPHFMEKFDQRLNSKIIIKFGTPFTLNFTESPSYEEIRNNAHLIDLNIAQIWGQKRIYPNIQKEWQQKEYGPGKPRSYKLLK